MSQPLPNLSSNLIELVATFAECLDIAFDRVLAGRAIAESPTEEGNDGSRLKLTQTIASLANIRIQSESLTLAAVRNLVVAGVPAATFVGKRGDANHWVMVKRVRGSRIWIVDSETHQERLVSLRQLMRQLGMSNGSTAHEWFLARQSLVNEKGFDQGQDDGHEGQTPPSPFKRLLALVHLERSDITTVLIFSSVLSVLSLASPLAVEALVNTVAWGRYLQPIFVLSSMLLIVLLFSTFLNAVIAYVVEILQRRIFVKLTDDLAFRIPRVDQRGWEHDYPPELLNRFFDVLTIQKALSKLLVDGFSVVIQTLVGLAVLAFYHPWLLGFDLILLTLMLVIVFFLGRGAVKTAIKESKSKYKIASWLQEISRHPAAFKLNGGADLALYRTDHLVAHYLDYRRAHFRIVLRQFVFSWLLYAFAATTLLGLGGWLVVIGELTLGQLVAAELIVVLVVGAFTKIGKQLETFYDLLASVDKVGTLLDLPLEPHTKLRNITRMPPKICLRDVAVKVDGGATLPPLTASFEAGSSVAILGGLSSAKSLITDLLTGVRRPDGGAWEWDGIDSRELRLESLRSQVGVASEPQVFSGSLEDNVHLGRQSVSGTDVNEALQAVKLLDEVLALPDSLSTELQTGGKPLSNSQIARLMLARAIVSKPALLIIEGTLDGFSDSIARDLFLSIRNYHRGTLVLTTARRTLASFCEKIVEIGDPGELGGLG